MTVFSRNLSTEKKLNVNASNRYFKKKQESYKKSKVQILLILSSEHKEWGLNQPDYLNKNKEQATPIPTPEDLEAIRELKRKGLI